MLSGSPSLGWPEMYDPSEQNDRIKYTRKLERDVTSGLTQAVKETVAGAIKSHS